MVRARHYAQVIGSIYTSVFIRVTRKSWPNYGDLLAYPLTLSCMAVFYMASIVCNNSSLVIVPNPQ